LREIEGVDRYYQGNPLNFLLNLRAMLSSLTYWVVSDKEPPQSNYPKFSNETLVQFEQYTLPKELKGLTIPVSPHTAYISDYGDQWDKGVIVQTPPRLLATVVPPVPVADEYGNELGGMRHPLLKEPIASFLPWVLRRGEFAQDEMMDFRGSLKLLPKADVLKRYSNIKNYIEQLNKAINESISEGSLLDEDREAVREQAVWLWDLVMSQSK
jgi:hypothetical protein